MKHLLRLVIFPIVGVALIALGFRLSSHELSLYFFGKSTAGEVVGMLLVRPENIHLVTNVETHLLLTLANGTRIEANYWNYRPTSLRSGLAGEALATSDLNQSLSTPLRKVLNDAVRGEADILRWAVQREGRRAESDRTIRIEKTEIVRGFFGLTSLPEPISSRQGEIVVNNQFRESAGEVRIRAVFDNSDANQIRMNNGEVMSEYEQMKNGVAVTPAKRNFLLHGEPYATEFRPVFRYSVNGMDYVGLSQIGRHGGPTLAIRLYEPCRVFYDPEKPSDAVLIADPGPWNGEYLAWFSRYCEGAFGQWGASALLMFAGATFFLVGLIGISLAWKSPSGAARGLKRIGQPKHA